MLLLVGLCAGAAAATTLAVPGRSSANVSMASSGRVVAVAWSASLPSGVTDVYAAVSRDGGRTFGEPVRVNDVPGDARVSGEQPPRVTVAPRGAFEPEISVVWTSKGSRGTRLLFARSADGGRSFGRAETAPGSDAPGHRGWQAAAADPSGRVLTVWLDHRGLAQQPDAAETHRQPGTPDGVAMAQRSSLYVGSLDRDLAPRAVTAGVCYCCKTALAVAGDRVYAAWRQVYAGNIRDIAFAVSRDGGRTFGAPARVSDDHWVLEGCPDDGPAIATRGERVHVVWPTLVQDGAAGEPTIAIFHASTIDGRRFTARQRLPTEGMPHHPQVVAAPDGHLVMAWDESAGGTRRIAIADGTAEADGRLRAARVALGGEDVGVYPALAATVEGVVLAWSSGGTGAVVRVRTVEHAPR